MIPIHQQAFDASCVILKKWEEGPMLLNSETLKPFITKADRMARAAVYGDILHHAVVSGLPVPFILFLRHKLDELESATPYPAAEMDGAGKKEEKEL